MFGKSSKHKDGYLSNCKLCVSEKRKKYFKENPEAYKNKQLREKVWKSKNKKRVLELDANYRSNNRDKLNKKSRDYYKNNKESVRKHKQKYEINNPEVRAKIKVKRRLAKANAIPKWSESEKIKTIYQKAKWLESITGLKYHVDHIIPLQGKNVCGLHVWSNLQILEASLNCSKQDKYGKEN